MTGTEAVAAIRDWMLDLHHMGRQFSDDERQAAESAVMNAVSQGANFQQAFRAGVAATNNF